MLLLCGPISNSLTMRTYNMNDAQDPYELEEDAMGRTYGLEMLKHNTMEGDIHRLS